MSNRANVFLGIAFLCLAIGFVAGHRNDIINGLGKALFGVFMILFFIDRFFGERKPS
jgi:hypothetical protein